MIEQNLKIKEQNMKLRLLNQNLSNKIEDKNLAIRQHITSFQFEKEARKDTDQLKVTKQLSMKPEDSFMED